MNSNAHHDRFLTKAALAAAVLLAIALPAAAAEPGQLTDEQRARLEARFEELRERLDLREEQETQLEPVLRKDLEQRAEVMRRHGVTRDSEQRPNRQTLRALRRDLQAVRDATAAEVERILDDRQMEEYRRIQEQARDEMRARLRSRRQGAQE